MNDTKVSSSHAVFALASTCVTSGCGMPAFGLTVSLALASRASVTEAQTLLVLLSTLQLAHAHVLRASPEIKQREQLACDMRMEQ